MSMTTEQILVPLSAMHDLPESTQQSLVQTWGIPQTTGLADCLVFTLNKEQRPLMPGDWPNGLYQKSGDWLFIVGGNHDAWSGAGDPIKWIARQQNAIYQSSECRMLLRPNLGTAIRVNCRHDYAGHSQFNTVHGPSKALQFGCRDHIAIAGHRHISGHTILKSPDDGIVMHAVRVASYKIYDRFAMDKGFRDQNISPCVFAVVNPSLPETHPDLIKLFWDPEHGRDYLDFLRSSP